MESGKWYRRRFLAASLRVVLGLEQPSIGGRWVPPSKADDAYSSANSVSNWRVPRTPTALSWRDGDVGRLFVTIASDKLSDAQLKKAKCLRGYAVVHGPTHMWRP